MTPIVRCKQKHAHGSIVAAVACDNGTKAPVAIVVYDAYAGDGDGSYTSFACYDGIEQLLAEVRDALEAGRHVLIEPKTMTRQAYEAQGDPFPANHNPLLRPNL